MSAQRAPSKSSSDQEGRNQKKARLVQDTLDETSFNQAPLLQEFLPRSSFPPDIMHLFVPPPADLQPIVGYQGFPAGFYQHAELAQPTQRAHDPNAPIPHEALMSRFSFFPTHQEQNHGAPMVPMDQWSLGGIPNRRAMRLSDYVPPPPPPLSAEDDIIQRLLCLESEDGLIQEHVVRRIRQIQELLRIQGEKMQRRRQSQRQEDEASEEDLPDILH